MFDRSARIFTQDGIMVSSDLGIMLWELLIMNPHFSGHLQMFRSNTTLFGIEISQWVEVFEMNGKNESLNKAVC